MSDDDPVLGGYEVTHDLGIRRLALPQPVAHALRERLLDEEQRQREEHEAMREQRRADSAAERNGTHLPPIPEQAPPGHHRVLPDFELVMRSLSQEGVITRSPDKEVRERLVTIGKRLGELGPDRVIGHPAQGQLALDELERSMPNFSPVIERVRQALTLAEASGTALRIPPLLLLGPPGVGKTLFSQRLAALMGVPHAAIAFDQPSYGSKLRGSDKAWGNSEAGLLFKLICLGPAANPVVLLDELDKSAGTGVRNATDPLIQLHGALEPQTARRIQDQSIDIEFDASLVTYVATANDPRGLGMPLLSRFDVFAIAPPTGDEAVQVARQVIDQVLHRLRLQGAVSFDRKCAYVLAHLSPRLMQRSVERLAGMALRERRERVREEDCWQVIEGSAGPRPH